MTDDKELIRELEAISKAGYGVVEVMSNAHPTGIIPEGKPHAGENYADVYGMGSEEWSRSIRTILKKANELGIRVDFHISVNNGSNTHVPGISPNDDAASKTLVHKATTVTDAVNNLPPLSEITPATATYVSNIDGSTQNIQDHFYAALLVNVTEKNKKVNKLIEADGLSGERRGKAGITTFDANYDIIDPNKTIDVSALYNPETTLSERNKVKDEIKKVYNGEGNWEILGFWWRGEGASISGVTKYPSYKIDYFSQAGTDAVMDYYEKDIFRLGQPGYEDMKNLLKKNGGHIFSDSYGASANWALELPEKFKELTGKEITKYLPAIFYATNDTNASTKFGFAFSDGSEVDVLEEIRQAMTDLHVKYHLEGLTKRSNELGLLYRAQVVYATSRLDMIQAAAAVDVPDVESLNLVDSIDYYTAMSSANHLLGKDEVSNELSATYGTKIGAYALPIKTVVDQANRAFAAGINQSLLHTYAYSYMDTPGNANAMWPGRSPFGNFFSEAWKDNMPQWEHMDILGDYLARTSFAIREGTTKRDIAVYKHSYWWPRHVSGIWRDPELSDAGFTYDFLSPASLDLPEATVKNGKLASNTAEYQAFVFDTTNTKDMQDVGNALMTLSAVKKMVEYANAGLPIIMVGSYPTGMPGIVTNQEKAEFDSAITKLKKSKNVVVVASQGEVPSALTKLKVAPYAENKTPERIMSYRTKTEDADIYYVYNRSRNYVEGIDSTFHNSLTNYGYKKEDGGTVTTKIALTGEGVPYTLNAYTGKIERIGNYEVDSNGKIVVEVTLDVNDATLIAVAPKNWVNGDQVSKKQISLQDSIVVDNWDLEIKSFTNKNDISAVGPDASEMKYTTISNISLPTLKTWTELGTIKATVTEEDGTVSTKDVDLGTISGVGNYSTTLTLPSSWKEKNGAYLTIENSYDTVRVSINGVELPNVNPLSLKTDISGLLTSGDNTIEIETVTTLGNALSTIRPAFYNRKNDYGITGQVKIIPFTKK
nr:glycosyl hydrolase [Robertmurraya korlensis]